MKKRLLTLMLAVGIIFTITTPAIAAETVTATPTASTVLVNGKNVAFDAYTVNGNNYFKLRDLAYTLSGTAKQFDIGWDGANNAISLTSGKVYTATGGEMTAKGAGSKTAAPTNSKIYLDGKEVAFTAYNIDGNNYFKLRDIGQAFNFGVDWDGAKNTIVIDTSKGYVEAPMEPAEPQELIDGKYILPDIPVSQQRSNVKTSSNGITVGEFLQIVCETTFPSMVDKYEPESPDENPYSKYFIAAQMANQGGEDYRKEEYMSLYISRAEVACFMATLHARIYKIRIESLDGYTSDIMCDDISKLPPWVYSYIYYCIQKDLMPIQNGSWKPFDGISEDELLEILYKLDYVY